MTHSKILLFSFLFISSFLAGCEENAADDTEKDTAEDCTNCSDEM